VFVYDDGPVEDHSTAFPVHQEFEAPATSGIVSGWVGRNQYMDVGQLKELADAGWEIASHTVEHTTVDSATVTEPIAATDTSIYPDHIRHGYHEGKTLVITDGEQEIRREIAGLGRDSDDVRYIELTEEISHSFPATEAEIHYPETFVEESLAKSKRELEDLGFDVESFLVPYDKFDAFSMQFVPPTTVPSPTLDTVLASTGRKRSMRTRRIAITSSSSRTQNP